MLPFVGELFQTTLWGFFIFVLPGLGLLAWLVKKEGLSFPERIGVAAGVSLALYPILLLGLRVFNLPFGAIAAWIPGSIGGLLWAWSFVHYRQSSGWPIFWKMSSVQWIFNASFLTVVLALAVTRLWSIRGVITPMWGDSVQHTLIAQLMIENGGLFSSWEPYAPIQTMTYHFGLHSAIAAWTWMTGTPTTLATLITGQVLNVLAIIALYPLAVRLSGNRWAGIAAMIVAGLWVEVPGYYVNWGRYTQLAGQVLLPALIWAIDLWWLKQERPARGVLVVLALLAAGLALTHYRVAMLAAAAGFAWLLWSSWRWRHTLSVWVQRTLMLFASVIGAGILLIPWAYIVLNGRLVTIYTNVANRPTDLPQVRGDLATWYEISKYYPTWLWWGMIPLLGFALWRRQALAIPLSLWAIFSFFATNPFFLQLPGTGVITNFLVLIGLYIPLALIWGWSIGLGIEWAANARQTVFPLAVSALLLVMVGYGGYRQAKIVDPFFQMVTPTDIAAFQWIEETLSEDAYFAVNGFLAFNNSLMVGSDAGWWLPYYTQRSSILPPILYTMEQIAAGFDRRELRESEQEIRTSNGDPAYFIPPLCRLGVTHIYLGEKQGTVGYGATALLPAPWLMGNPSFTLLHQEGNAQIWRFDREVCTAYEK